MVDCLQADATRCGGITGLLAAARGRRRPRARPLRHTARRRSTRTLSRGAEAAPPRVVPRPRPDRADAVRRLPRARGRLRSAPTGRGPASASSSARADAERYCGHDVHDAARGRTLRAAIDGEVRFSAGDRALYATTGSNYRQVPIGVVIPRTVDDVVAAVAVCREHGAPDPVPRRRHEPRRPVRERRGRGRLLQVPQPHPRDRPRAAARARRAGRRPRPPARGGRGPLRAHVRPRSVDARPLHARRDDRQQLLRRPLGDVAVLRPGPAHVGQRRRARGAHLPRRAAARRAPSGEGVPDELRRRGCAASADRYGDLVRERYPKIPRRVSGYNLDDLLPENGFHVARALAGTEGTCVTVLEATVHLIDEPALPHARRRRLRGRGRRRRPRPGRARAPAARARGRRRAADRGHDDARPAPSTTSRCSRTDAAGS